MRISSLGLLKFSTALITVLMASACGGGGGNKKPTVVTPPPVVDTGPSWTKGRFSSESTFVNKCERPRTGIDPSTNRAYLDTKGSTLHENHWLRSWSNDKYLWYSEIEDVDPANFTDAQEYFKVLKTEAVTASGTPKDQFHFIYATEEYQQLVSSGAAAGYGVRWQLISRSVPREIRVAYTEKSGAASTAPASLLRGAEVIEVDGIDVINGGTSADVDALNAAVFPNSAGETHTFTVRDVGSTDTRTFDMTSSIVTSDPVNISKTIDTANGKTGYILFNTFGTSSAEEQIIAAMTQFSNEGVSDLILDLRYNGGGFLDIAGQVGYMIAGPGRTTGKTFDNIVFNDKHPTVNPVTNRTLTPTPFHSTSLGFSVDEGQALPFLNLNRIFILSTSRTCSASEAVINGLRGVDVEVVLVGTTTCGKPFGFYATDNCGTTYFTIQFQGKNEKGFGDYTDGFTAQNSTDTEGEKITGCAVDDDFLHPLGNTSEDLLSTSLSYIQNGVCPLPVNGEPSSKTRSSQGDRFAPTDPTSLYNDERLRMRTWIEESRIMTRPNKKEK